MNSEICTKQYYMFNEVSAGIAIIKQYVQKTSQILVGGQSIDYALRLKGVKLYEDWELPDLDFQTDDYANVAYSAFREVASILANKSDITVLNALHPTSMRVQVGKFAVADVTFVPTKVINIYRESALVYDGCLIRHPFFQYIDIQRSFSYPYENPMREVISHRWAKDFKRFMLTMKYYSPHDKKLVDEFVGKYNLKDSPNLAKLGMKKNRLSKRMMSKQRTSTEPVNVTHIVKLYKFATDINKPLSLIGVINGELAYYIYRTIYRKMIGKTPNNEFSISSTTYKGNINFLNSYLMTLDDKERFMATNAKLMENIKETNPYIDVIPSRTILGSFEIINVAHKTSYHNINLSKIDSSWPNITVKVVSINFLVLYISMLWITLRSNIYLSLFIKLLKMLEKVYSITTKPADIHLLFPSIETYGSEIPHIFELNKLQFKKPENIFINKYNSLETALGKISKFEYPEIYNLDGL